jgi:hypothetical protein
MLGSDPHGRCRERNNLRAAEVILSGDFSHSREGLEENVRRVGATEAAALVRYIEEAVPEFPDRRFFDQRGKHLVFHTRLAPQIRANPIRPLTSISVNNDFALFFNTRRLPLLPARGRRSSREGVAHTNDNFDPLDAA